MRAELQACDHALEIAVSDAEPGEPPSSEATVCLLPRRPGALLELALAPEIDPAHALSWEDYEDAGLLLEPSDVVELDVTRSSTGLSAPHPSGAAEPVFEPAPLIDIGKIGFAKPEPAPEPEPELDIAVELAEPEPDIALEPAEPPDLTLPIEPEPAFELPTSEPSPPDPIRAPVWRNLNTSRYAFVRGLRGMSQSPLVQLLAIGTMAVCMLLLGTAMLIFSNAQRVARDLGVDTPVTVYMQPSVDLAAAEQLRERVAGLPEVARAELVSPEQALASLRAGAGQEGEQAELLAGIDAGVLPYSLEIELAEGVEPGFADALAGRVQSMDGVEDVSVLGPWVQEVDNMLATLRVLALGVAGLVSLACLAIVWSTIRLGVFARRAELQILRLVGGTARFVRGPFVVEGVVQGVLGTALALTVLWLVFDLTRPFLERGMSLMFAAGSLTFFSIAQMAIALGFGGLLGWIGARAAVARHVEA
jgi:cell division transport system permease protein